MHADIPDDSDDELTRARAEIERLARDNRALLENLRQHRQFISECLSVLTEGRLRLCEADALPPRRGEQSFATALRSETLRDLRRAVREAAAGIGFDSVRRHDLELATGEAAMNAVVHAGGGVGAVHVDAGGRVQVWIEDRGGGIDLTKLPLPPVASGAAEPAKPTYGLWMVLRTVDRLWLATGPGGTTAVLEQGDEAPPPEPAWLTALR